MKIKYQNLVFRTKVAALIAKATKIVEEYEAQGYQLTLRQLYYQLVARGEIPNNSKEYDKLGQHVSNARRAGLISWSSIVDRTRFLRAPSAWDGPEDILKGVAVGYKRNLWEGQKHRVEVWFEKDALLGIFERAAELHRLPIFSCRGYVSDSEVWGAAQRLRRFENVTILHFGDHDPSGLDMTRDIDDRLALFGSPHVHVKRIALNMDQIEQYSPPPNPAKETDSRFADYREKYGDESWELDSLEPSVLERLVLMNVTPYIDTKIMGRVLNKEKKEKMNLHTISEKYAAIVKALPKL